MKAMSDVVTNDQIVSKKLIYLFFLIAVIGAFLGGMGVIGAQNNFNSNENLTKVVDFLLEQNTELRSAFTDRGDLLEELENDIISNQTETNERFSTFQNEIVAIKKDIKNKFPQASTVETQKQTSIGTTPFLTLKMDQTEFLLGEIIQFHGNASPTHAVIITIKLPDRMLESVAVSKSNIINGEYTAEFQTRFDDAKGTWQVYARQLDDQTKTLTFKVE